MKAGKYSVRELFVNNYIDQIIVPEIQRDYVWGHEQVIGLMANILEDFSAYENGQVPLETNDTEIKNLFENFYKKQKFSSNIGFIYAYNDPEYVGKYFLIDGQQRTTTIYLMLLAVCLKTDKATFEKYYFSDEALKIDYKVRDAAHTFFQKFVQYILEEGDPIEASIKNQFWYFSFNDLDPTIQSIIQNYNHINTFLERNNLFTPNFLHYIQHLIEFWYFDTNLSDQGEELYIYMNARGEQIQSNENLKADLLGKLSIADVAAVIKRPDYKETNDLEGLKSYWGKKWEGWQDFFWQRRGENENADIGFNEFINCIAGLELYKSSLAGINKNDSKIDEILTLKSIEHYLEALAYLENECDSFCEQYDYAEWVNAYKTLIWSYLNKSIKRNANWFADFKDRNKNDDRNNMILMWSFFYYFEANFASLNRDEFFRVIRFFYVRYHNYNRSVSTLKKTIDLITINGIIDSTDNELQPENAQSEEETDSKLRTNEEKSKYAYLSMFVDKPDELRQFESVIWKIEDHQYNLDGSYLKNTNITHLINFEEKPTLVELQKICDRFYLLMDFGKVHKEAQLVNLLLHYGEFWQKETPNYYCNYRFNNWRRIIRGTDGNAFSLFFHEFLATETLPLVAELINQKNKDFLTQHLTSISTLKSFREQLIVYSILLDNIWSQGYHTCHESQEMERRFFDEELNMFNCLRYKGSHWYFWESAKALYLDKAGIFKALQEKVEENKEQINA